MRKTKTGQNIWKSGKNLGKTYEELIKMTKLSNKRLRKPIKPARLGKSGENLQENQKNLCQNNCKSRNLSNHPKPFSSNIKISLKLHQKSSIDGACIVSLLTLVQLSLTWHCFF